MKNPISPSVFADVLTPAKSSLITTRDEGLKLISPISMEVEDLEVFDADTYAVADALFGRIKKARRTWTERMEKIIRPIRTGLDELYSLNREVDKPLGKLEDAVEAKMKIYKLEEARQIRDAERLQQAELDRLQREADAKEAAALNARTAQMRGKLEAARQRIVEQAEVVLTQEIVAPVQGEKSSTRSLRLCRVSDLLAFASGVATGTIPTACITVNTPELNRQFKRDPTLVEGWPGVEGYDDVQIIGR